MKIAKYYVCILNTNLIQPIQFGSLVGINVVVPSTTARQHRAVHHLLCQCGPSIIIRFDAIVFSVGNSHCELLIQLKFSTDHRLSSNKTKRNECLKSYVRLFIAVHFLTEIPKWYSDVPCNNSDLFWLAKIKRVSSQKRKHLENDASDANKNARGGRGAGLCGFFLTFSDFRPWRLRLVELIHPISFKANRLILTIVGKFSVNFKSKW